MIRAHADGDLERARAVNEELQPAYELLRVTTNPIAIKTALGLLGHDVGGFRLPMVDASDDELAEIRDCLSRGDVPAAA
jgi:4-hydroxy-tetrahydrodipicolinate synthase